MCKCMYKYYASKFQFLWPWSCKDLCVCLTASTIYRSFHMRGWESACLGLPVGLQQESTVEEVLCWDRTFSWKFCKNWFQFLPFCVFVSEHTWLLLSSWAADPFTACKTNVKICLKSVRFSALLFINKNCFISRKWGWSVFLSHQDYSLFVVRGL